MTELLVRWKTKIDWIDYLDWDYTSQCSIVEGEKYLSLKINGYGSISKDILEVGKKYNVKFNINDFTGTGGVRIFNGIWNSGVISGLGEQSVLIDTTTNTNFIIKSENSNTNLEISNLEIEEVGYQSLDLFDNTQIALNFSIVDVRDYEKRKGTFSKTIQIPGSSKNNKFFRYIFNINEDNTFTLNTKCSAAIQKNNITFVEGYISLDNIILRDDKILYEVGFYGDQLNLFNDIGDDMLEDLDCSDLDHTVGYQKIIDQFLFPDGSSANSGYCYPWIDYGADFGSIGGCVGKATDDTPSVGLTTHDFLPAISVKYLIDKIFSTYGYEYSSSKFEDPYFRRLILPYVNDIELLQDWYLVSRLSFGGNRNITSLTQEDTYGNMGSPGSSAVSDYYGNDWMRCDRDAIPSASYHVGYTGIWCNYTYDINGRKLERYRRFNYGPFVNSNWDSSLPLPGVAGESNPNKYQTHYNHIPGSYLVRKGGGSKYKIRMSIRVDVLEYYGGTGYKGLRVTACKVNQSACSFFYSDTPGDNKWKISNAQPNSSSPEETHIVRVLGENDVGTGFIDIEYTFDNCIEGDMLYWKVRGWGLKNGWVAHVSTITVYEYGWGEDVDVLGNNLAPKDFKIRDFLKDLITMYNLYIDIDPQNPRKLIIEPRDKYYEDGETKDWTYKLDFSKDIVLTSPKDYQSYMNKLMYQEDKDYTSQLYNKKFDTQDVKFGGKRFIIVSDFATGEKELKLSKFASTPMRNVWGVNGATGKEQFVVSRMWDCDYPSTPVSYEKKTTWKPRILTYKVSKIYDNDYSVSANKRRFRYDYNSLHETSTAYRLHYCYPYAGHIYDPWDLLGNNNYDLNFDTKLRTKDVWQKLFNGDPGWAMTNRNLYNLYYKNQFDQIINKDSRIMTAYFKLDVNDIKELRLSDIIFVNGTYFTINKIIDFSPEEDTVTKVELLKIVDGAEIEFTDYQGSKGNNGSPVLPGGLGLSLGRENKIRLDDYSLTVGDGNIVGEEARNSVIIGDGNNVTEKSALLNVDNSYIGSKSTILNSKSVEVASGLTNVTVIGENKLKITEDNVAYINGVKIQDGVVLERHNVDGGEIETDGVFNAFKFRNYHINSSGENGNDDFDINIWEVEDGGEI